MNEEELREHLAEHHPAVRQATMTHPRGRPTDELEWAHSTQHERFPSAQDHSHPAGSGVGELSVEDAARQRAVADFIVARISMQHWEAAEALWEAGRKFGTDLAEHDEAHYGQEPGCPWCTEQRAKEASRDNRICGHCGAALFWRPGPNGDEWVDNDSSNACRNVPMPNVTASVVLHEPKEER